MYCSIHNLTNANLFGYAIIELITISRTVETRGAEGAPDPHLYPRYPLPTHTPPPPPPPFPGGKKIFQEKSKNIIFLEQDIRDKK